MLGIIIINIISSSMFAIIIVLDIREHNNYAITNIINPSIYMCILYSEHDKMLLLLLLLEWFNACYYIRHNIIIIITWLMIQDFHIRFELEDYFY